MNLSKLIGWIMIVGLIVGSAAAVIHFADKSRGEIPVYGPVAEFELTERSGQAFQVAAMKDKITILNFFFTTCPGPCPRMNARVAELYRGFSTSDKVQFVSITVDPDRDSLQTLRAYAAKMGVTDNRWLFLRGPGDEIHRISEKIFMLGGELPSMHSTKLILIDADLQIRGYYSSEDEAVLQMLKTHVRELVERLPA